MSYPRPTGIKNCSTITCWRIANAIQPSSIARRPLENVVRKKFFASVSYGKLIAAAKLRSEENQRGPAGLTPLILGEFPGRHGHSRAPRRGWTSEHFLRDCLPSVMPLWLVGSVFFTHNWGIP